VFRTNLICYPILDRGSPLERGGMGRRRWNLNGNRGAARKRDLENRYGMLIGHPACRQITRMAAVTAATGQDAPAGSQKCISTEPVGILVRILLEFDLYGIRRLSTYC
jgi:hypothetical protein